MTKNKWLYSVLLVLVAGAVLFLYNAFNGNPLSKLAAKSTLKDHLESTYPEDRFVIQKEFFNFKDGGYNFFVTQIGDEQQTEYGFFVTGFFGSMIQSDGIYYANQDEVLIDRLQKEAGEELLKFLQEKVPYVREVRPLLEVLKGKYSADTKWSKAFKPEKPMYIHIMIDSRELSKEQMLQQATIIQTSLNEAQYAYDHVTINGNIVDDSFGKVEDEESWVVKYAVGFEPDTQLELRDIDSE